MKRSVFVLLFPFILFGCAGIQVKQDYDTSVDFHRLKTYAWQTSKQTGVDSSLNSLMRDRIHKAVDAQLAQKGYRKVSDNEADYLVDCEYVVERESDTGQVHSGIGLGGGSGGLFGGISLGVGSGQTDSEYEELSIGIVDPRAGQLLWQGSTREPLEGSPAPEQTTDRINKTVKSILAKFPPK